MSVHVKSFYPKKDDDSDAESESRWGHPKIVSDLVVPPSEPPLSVISSAPLSAPSSGFSSPKGSVNTSEHSAAASKKSKHMFSFPNLLKQPSRFVNSLKRQATKTQPSQHAVELITQLQRKNDLCLPSTNTAEKCDVWMSGCEYAKANSSNCTKKPVLVEYSPSGSNTSSLQSNRSVSTPLKRHTDKENGEIRNPHIPAKRSLDLSTAVAKANTHHSAANYSDTSSLSTHIAGKQTTHTEPVNSKATVSRTVAQSGKPTTQPIISLKSAQATVSRCPQDTPVKRKSPSVTQSGKPTAHDESGSTSKDAAKAAVSSCPQDTLIKPKSPSVAQSAGKPTTQPIKSLKSAKATVSSCPQDTLVKPKSPSVTASGKPTAHQSGSSSKKGAQAAVSRCPQDTTRVKPPKSPSITLSGKPTAHGSGSSSKKPAKASAAATSPDISSPQLSNFPSTVPSGQSLKRRRSGSLNYAESESDHETWGADISDSDEDWNPIPKQSQEEHISVSDSDSSSDDIISVDEESIERGPGDHDLEAEEEAANKSTNRILKAANKLLRNSGKAYVSSVGTNISARERKQVHQCPRRKCHLVINNDVADTLFNDYWSQANYDKRVAYISNRIEYTTIERSRRRDFESNRAKEITYQYFFEVEGVRHQVCKSTFLDVLGETDSFLRRCAAKKQESLSGITRDDRRGRQTPKHALLPATKEEIVTHIKSFPAYVSHYCRSQTKQKYLSNSLNVQIMYDLFVAENPTLKLSYSSYYRIFASMKLKFKAPASDTCGTCDEFVVLIKSAETEEKRQNLQRDYELHLRKAEAGYSLKRKIKALANADDSIRVLIFDLEQVLPTPLVPTGKAFYLRQLNTYNLTVVDCKTNKTFCYMWHECEAARGANQIASCLFSHMMDEVPNSVKKVYLFSDCCSGQNRNSIVSAMHQVTLQVHQSIKTIHHIFLVPGHTRMECDSMHSVIQASKSKVTIVAVPQEWYSLVRGSGKKGSFHVTEMKDSFYDFNHLLTTSGPLLKREKKEDGDKMYFTQTHWFTYKKNHPGIIYVKSSFNIDAEYATYSMIRGNGKNRKLPQRWYAHVPECVAVNAISVKKKKDLLSLLNYIDPVHHAFYHDLKTDATITDETDPDLPEEAGED